MNDDTCCVPGCAKPIKVQIRRLCGMHNARLRRRGDVHAARPRRDDRLEEGQLWCSRCHARKPIADFYRNAASRTGYDGMCIACLKQRRSDTKVQRAAARRARRNRPGMAARLREQNRRHRLKYRERYMEMARQWRKDNPDRVRLHIRAQNAIRSARVRNAPGEAAPEQILARWRYYGGLCWMCSATATDTDHVKPIARGGSNWASNLRPACRSCNRSKSDTWPYDPARPLPEADPVDRRVSA